LYICNINSSFDKDFIVLGENYLTELKDKLSCFRNEIRVGEFSQNPDQIKEAPLMKDLIKSSFFFIENVVYNDLRNDNTDCSMYELNIRNRLEFFDVMLYIYIYHYKSYTKMGKRKRCR
jgi:hypothetical protein